MGSSRRNNRKRQLTGKNYARSLVLDKKIKGLEAEIAAYEAAIAEREIVHYDGKKHTFSPFWTRSPGAHKRPVIIQKQHERSNKRDA